MSYSPMILQNKNKNFTHFEFKEARKTQMGSITKKILLGELI